MHKFCIPVGAICVNILGKRERKLEVWTKKISYQHNIG